jgi:hypothetical protein
MSILSKLAVAASIADFSVKKFFFDLIGFATIAAAGSDETDATALTAGTNFVTGADGAVGVILPVAEEGMRVEVINTVSNQDLLVYPNTGAQINALTATTGAFTQVAGSRALYACNTAFHWYVAAANLTGTATTASTAELNVLDAATSANDTTGKAAILGTDGAITFGGTVTAVGSFIIGSADLNEADMEKLDGITNGTQAADKAVVANSDVNIGVVKATELHVGASGSEVQVTATPAEINAVADVSARVVSAAAGTLAVTAAAHGGRIIAFDQTGGTAATLPAATGTGNVYHFVVKVKNTSSANTIVLADASDLFQGQVINTDADATTPVSYTANAAGDIDTISLNGTTTGGQIGDWIEVVDIASNVYAVRGFVVCPAGSNVATPLLTGQVS